MRTLGLAVALSIAIVGLAGAQNLPPTQRTADGHPDLSGTWRPAGGVAAGGRAGQDTGDRVFEQQIASRRCHPGQRVEGLPKGRCVNQALDQEFIAEALVNGEVVFSGRWEANRPIYKPQFWDRIQELDRLTNTEDPIMKCLPIGIPRMSIPAPGRDGGMARIVQLPGEIIMFYADANGTSPRDVRMIPTDGRMHTDADYEAMTFWGRSVGRWEGDTLVIDSVGFNDLTWLERGGLFTSTKLHIIERLRREGDVLHYAITVEDPEVLLQPWVMPERQLRLNTNPNARFIAESPPCSVDLEQLAAGTHLRH